MVRGCADKVEHFRGVGASASGPDSRPGRLAGKVSTQQFGKIGGKRLDAGLATLVAAGGQAATHPG